MYAKKGLGGVRLFLGAGTVATLLGLWSALTVHDLQASKDAAALGANNSAVTTTVNTAPAPSNSAPSRTTTTTVKPVPHTRTHAS